MEGKVERNKKDGRGNEKKTKKTKKNKVNRRADEKKNRSGKEREKLVNNEM